MAELDECFMEYGRLRLRCDRLEAELRTTKRDLSLHKNALRVVINDGCISDEIAVLINEIAKEAPPAPPEAYEVAPPDDDIPF